MVFVSLRMGRRSWKPVRSRKGRRSRRRRWWCSSLRRWLLLVVSVEVVPIELSRRWRLTHSLSFGKKKMDEGGGEKERERGNGMKSVFSFRFVELQSISLSTPTAPFFSLLLFYSTVMASILRSTRASSSAGVSRSGERVFFFATNASEERGGRKEGRKETDETLRSGTRCFSFHGSLC